MFRPVAGSVALRKESVDRNVRLIFCVCDVSLSLSARRAWIEITVRTTIITICIVALRKESVDRNTSIDNLTQGVFKSLSARRAWIEIIAWNPSRLTLPVALRKESVDRNILALGRVPFWISRSPQGERG